jgi:hypothetical protein
VIDTGESAGAFERTGSKWLLVFRHLPDLGRAPGVSPGVSEVDAIVGQHGVDLHGVDQGVQKVCGDTRRDF